MVAVLFGLLWTFLVEAAMFVSICKHSSVEVLNEEARMSSSKFFVLIQSLENIGLQEHCDDIVEGCSLVHQLLQQRGRCGEHVHWVFLRVKKLASPCVLCGGESLLEAPVRCIDLLCSLCSRCCCFYKRKRRKSSQRQKWQVSPWSLGDFVYLLFLPRLIEWGLSWGEDKKQGTL